MIGANEGQRGALRVERFLTLKLNLIERLLNEWSGA